MERTADFFSVGYHTTQKYILILTASEETGEGQTGRRLFYFEIRSVPRSMVSGDALFLVEARQETSAQQMWNAAWPSSYSEIAARTLGRCGADNLVWPEIEGVGALLIMYNNTSQTSRVPVPIVLPFSSWSE